MLERAKETYRAWIPVRRNMPQHERFGIGTRIDTLLLDLLETLRRASYTNTTHKPEVLGTAIGIADSIRFFLQVAWEVRLISNKHYEELATGIEEIGRMTGGWRKGILSKNPPK